MAEALTITVCSNMGLTGDKVYIQETPDGFEARQAVALFGDYQMTIAELEAIGYDPFHVDFHDNFVRGKGETQQAAIEALEKDAKEMADSLWR
ncbi:hypothetical protein [Alteromonas macleodii]|uniref:Uncharacterized protein n=1 Tax=Alteromonas macleodii TaxID=28108 RepID=A0AB36FL10_ALTMA|nr:hypothetical protein [Alteromonas macleodii]OES24144.1 hypothetical protein BFV93_4744 [Alteromonas macleodii]OES24778.1 hypothetical protein BFV95_4537 [Alteromonas macleodii]OES25056.1 hypothetical protein BFV94_4527 [Alteromonas macleodii]OES39099.1 hypothetical protein BFV96_4247 [Alteromonas macleodii]